LILFIYSPQHTTCCHRRRQMV